MTRVGCLALVLAALLLGGCDVMGSSKNTVAPKPLSHAEFVRRANHICTVSQRRAQRLKKPVTSHAVLVRRLNYAVRVFEQDIVAFRRLTPPVADAPAFGRLIADLDAEDVNAHRLVDAIEAGQRGRARTLGKKLDHLDKSLKRRSINLGLRICAKD